MVAAMYVDQAEKKRRESTFIISGLEGDQSGDRALVSDLCSAEFGLSLDIVSAKRLGQPEPGRVQPLLVVCRQAEQAQRLITDAKRLRNSTNLAVRERVNINGNLTKAEAEAAYRLRQQRRRAATSHPSVTVKPPAVQSDVDTTLSLLNMACNPTTSAQLLSSMPSGVGLSSFLSATNQAITHPSPLADNICSHRIKLFNSALMRHLQPLIPIHKLSLLRRGGTDKIDIKRQQLPNFLLSNIRSLLSKVDDPAAVMEINDTNIACITETWLDANIETEAVDIENYICHRRDRSDGRRAGGVACYVDARWSSVRLQSLESPDFEALWILVRRPIMPRQVSHIVVAVIYHPPDAASWPMCNYLISCADSILQSHPYAGIVILRDCNSLHDKPLRDFPMKQIVSRPTRGKSTLDKIFTNIGDIY
jgi:hypothetical protein